MSVISHNVKISSHFVIPSESKLICFQCVEIPTD